ncbi:hypothetical protein [Klebsiella phage Kpn74]|uniref:Uncharacterized protein n=1 Tax=Klebsiella phage Kpn74 TaxID=3044026 RepID=A0AAT9V5M7_9CAUD|nr:hypothetical protein [Klebsiella phage Kpn74]
MRLFSRASGRHRYILNNVLPRRAGSTECYQHMLPS